MQYGVILPNVGPLAGITHLTQFARHAESSGWYGVFLSDHIAVPAALHSRYPYRTDGRFPLDAADPILEPIVTLSYLAAVTRRIRLGFSVLVLPYRHPVLNAKMLSTLDAISGGRLILGAGVGWMAEEFELLDANYAERGAVTDEHIRILRALWTDDAPHIAGEHYRVSGFQLSPPPACRPHPPIWTGGVSPPALRRAARLGDGWHGVRQTPDDIRRVVARITELRANAGLPMDGYQFSLRAGLDITAAPLDGAGRTPLRGAPAQIAADLDEYARAGLTCIVLEPRAATPEQFIAQMDAFQPLLSNAGPDKPDAPAV